MQLILYIDLSFPTTLLNSFTSTSLNSFFIGSIRFYTYANMSSINRVLLLPFQSACLLFLFLAYGTKIPIHC